MRWMAAILTALALAAPAQAQTAGPLPDRRAVASPDTDLPGGDLRMLRGISAEDCLRVCRADPDCTALTFNARSGACFPKSAPGDPVPFAGAQSVRLIPTDPAAQSRAAPRAAALAFLPADLAASARTRAETLSLTPAGPLAPLADRTAQTDAAADWLALARAAAAADLPRPLRALPAEAALNAHLRAPTDAEAAEALAFLAEALEAEGRGPLTIPLLRLADSLAPSPAATRALARARRLHGPRVADHQVDFDAARPRLCVTFTEALAPGLDPAPFVRLDGAEAPVEAQDRQLCVDGLRHGARHALTIRQGLPMASGETLMQRTEIAVQVRDRTPAARFPGTGRVLPRGAGAALPVTTVNTDRLQLDLYRIGDRNLLPVVDQGLYGRALDDWTRTRIADQLGQALWTGTAEVDAPLNEDVTTLLPLAEALEGAAPGVYALTARVPDQTRPWEAAATQWFVLTDLAPAAALGADGLHVTVRGLSDALPRPGAQVRLISAANEVLAEAAADAQGRARFDPGLTRGRGGMAPALLTVTDKAGDFAFLDLRDPALDLSDRGVEGRPAPPPVDLFLHLARGAHRPGETVHATLLARDARGAAIEGLTLTAVVTRPDGVEHARMPLPDAGAGGRALALPLPASAQRGAWRLAILADPGAPPLATASFLVEDFQPERLALTLSAPDDPLDPAAPAPVTLQADWLYGAPAAGLRIEGETRLTPLRELAGFPGWVWGLESDDAPADLAVLPAGLLTDATGAAPEGGTAAFEVMALGSDLTPTALGPVAWTLSRVETEYQWHRLYGDWSWEAVTIRTRVASGAADLGAPGPVRIEAPVDWGRYELRLNTPDTAASLSFIAGWHGAAAADAPDRLTVGLDRAAYAVGDRALLRVTAPEAGVLDVKVLGAGLIESRSLTVAPGETAVPLTVTEAWAPGAYVTATLIRPMDAGAGRNPTRAMGLVWAAVDPGPRRLTARIEAPERTRPRGPLDVAVHVENLPPGAPAYVTLSATDLGILNLTGHAAPDPAGHVFGQRQLGVELRDLYGRLIDGLTGARGLVRSGGDAGLRRAEAPPPDQDLVAFFTGPLPVGPDGVVRASFDLPAFAGALRLSAVVWSAEGVGAASTETVVRDPVTATAAAPRFLNPGDTSRLRLDLAHLDGPAGEVTVRAEPSAALALSGPATRTVTLTEGGRAALDLPVQALAADEGAAVTLTLTLPSDETVTLRHPLPVRATDPDEVRVTRLSLPPGGRLTLDADAADGFQPGTARAGLAVGPTALLDVPGLLTALDSYPWGCSEQLASTALPLLYLADTAAAAGLGAPEDLTARIAAAVRGVLAHQDGSGSFGLWDPSGGGDLWLDAYIADFLTRARAQGHAVPDAALTAALDGLRTRLDYAGDFESGGEDVAYALMVLTREGRASLGDLRWYADARADAFATPLALGQLGAALAMMGDPVRADAMFRAAEAKLVDGDDAGFRADFGSPLRDAAALLTLASEAGSDAVDRTALAARLAAGPPANRRSPQENAWSLLAAHALDDTAQGLTVDGAPVTGTVLRFAEPGQAPVTVANTGAAAVDAVLTVRGAPLDPPPAGGTGYRIDRQWFTLDGDPADPAALRQGDRLVTVLTVTPQRTARARLIVSDPLPAGLEIDNPNLIAGGQPGRLAWLTLPEVAQHAEFRADRFAAAVDWEGAEPFRLAYVVRAVSPGAYRHPAASVEDMYRPEFRALTDTGTVTVAP